GLGAGGQLYRYLSLCDAVGNLCYSYEETAGVPARTLALTYDGADRLIREDAAALDGSATHSTQYIYDNANNRTAKIVDGQTTNYTYNNGNQLTGWSRAGASANFTYDFNGNRITR